MKNLLLTTATAAALLTGALVPSAFADDQTRVKIASSSVRENGCSETYQTFKANIPNSERLDRSYSSYSMPDGIEVVVREANGAVGHRNFAFTDSGTTVTYQLHARGGGTRIRNPFNGGSYCHNASGANITIDVYAHFKAPGA
jgi:hypothetical protein